MYTIFIIFKKKKFKETAKAIGLYILDGAKITLQYTFMLMN
jgi:hypothetical protein